MSDATTEKQTVTEAFLAGAAVVLEALSSPEVEAAWDAPSALEEQTVGSLAGHLARGSVWTVSEYLAPDEPTADLTFETAGEYFAAFADRARATDHQGIRDRGAEVAAVGHAALAASLRDRLDELRAELRDVSPERRLTVARGAVMRLDDYLRTRIVEQVVHLDDLARSVGRTWPVPQECVEVALAVGTEIGVRRYGPQAMIRSLYRQGLTEALPVL